MYVQSESRFASLICEVDHPHPLLALPETAKIPNPTHLRKTNAVSTCSSRIDPVSADLFNSRNGNHNNALKKSVTTSSHHITHITLQPKVKTGLHHPTNLLKLHEPTESRSQPY
jgi:hypothetical protein